MNTKIYINQILKKLEVELDLFENQKDSDEYKSTNMLMQTLEVYEVVGNDYELYNKIENILCSSHGKANIVAKLWYKDLNVQDQIRVYFNVYSGKYQYPLKDNFVVLKLKK